MLRGFKESHRKLLSPFLFVCLFFPLWDQIGICQQRIVTLYSGSAVWQWDHIGLRHPRDSSWICGLHPAHTSPRLAASVSFLTPLFQIPIRLSMVCVLCGFSSFYKLPQIVSFNSSKAVQCLLHAKMCDGDGVRTSHDRKVSVSHVWVYTHSNDIEKG